MGQQKTESVLSRFLKGVVIALGFILPGVSGGVLAAILGIYERMLRFMAHLTKNFKENLLFFLPVGIGGIVGIGLLSKPLEWLLQNYQIVVLWGFAGAIIGTLPALAKESTLKSKRTMGDLFWFFGTMIIGFLFLYFMGDILGTIPANFLGFVLAGGLIALGVLVPGLSPSNLLLVLGLYDVERLQGVRHFRRLLADRNWWSTRDAAVLKIDGVALGALSFESLSLYFGNCDCINSINRLATSG